MAKCTKCGKFKLFGSFPAGLCPDCKQELEAQRRAADRARRAAEAEAERRAAEEAKRAAEEKARRAAEEKAKHDADLAAQRAAAKVSIPSGKLLSYGYDINMFIPDPSVRNIPGFIKKTVLTVAQEPNNPYDPNAVSLSLNGTVVGYLYRGKHQDMANDFLKRGDFVIAAIDDVGSDKQASIRIEFYDDLGAMGRLLKKYPKVKPCRLTGNTNQDMQENISFCSRGDVCELHYDYGKDKYLVTDIVDIGYLSASAEKIIEEHGRNNCSVFVSDIGETDSGKSTISVYIFPED